MKIDDFFDKIIFLNSDKRRDRLKNMNERLAGLKNVERFPAIFGKESKAINIIRKDSLKVFENKERGRRGLNGGEIGCFISHREIWKLIKARGYKKALILEDDAIFESQFEFNIDKLPSDWDMLYLGQHNYDREFIVKSGSGKNAALIHHIDNNLYKASHCWLTHAYAVNSKCINYLLENTKTVDYPIDGVLAEIQDNLNVYAFYPNLINQDSTKSSLR